MAITQTQALPAPFITALGEKYGAGLAGLVDHPFTTAQLGQVAPQVAPQSVDENQMRIMRQSTLHYASILIGRCLYSTTTPTGKDFIPTQLMVEKTVELSQKFLEYVISGEMPTFNEEKLDELLEEI